MLLTPVMLDSGCSSSENSPLQTKASSLNKLADPQIPITDKKAPGETAVKYHHVRGAKSTCGKALLKLYPSFYEEEEDRIIPYNPSIQQKENCYNTHSTELTYSPRRKIHFPTPQESIQQIHREVLKLIKNRKYKQAVIKLYECERIACSSEVSISLRIYTKYLIVLVYYKIGKYDKCADAAEKSIKSYKEFSAVAEQYALHIKQLRAKSLCKVHKCEAAVGLLKEIEQQYGRIFEDSKFNNLIFSFDHLLAAKADMAECYLVHWEV
eukprot:TRINITY_DN2772_c0_g4_i1.p1 TRINITY_DN2772_c0_g4~~TRINITY_DN2772_c0_g4_i1.p1  ORF type:complete len:267 (-),score=39.82 TRINITY_DN2772_c0_g4_i1:1038-1838(-)